MLQAAPSTRFPLPSYNIASIIWIVHLCPPARLLTVPPRCLDLPRHASPIYMHSIDGLHTKHGYCFLHRTSIMHNMGLPHDFRCAFTISPTNCITFDTKWVVGWLRGVFRCKFNVKECNNIINQSRTTKTVVHDDDDVSWENVKQTRWAGSRLN